MEPGWWSALQASQLSGEQRLARRDEPLTDQALMRRVQAGETECFAELVERYRPALLRVAESRLGRRDWAEDAVQEAFLSAFKSRHTYRHAFSFRTWLWTILLNQCRRAGSSRARSPRVSCWADEAEGAQAPAMFQASLTRGVEPPLAQLLARERIQLLEAALARLSPAQADALRLRFFGALKFEEIAETMGCSLGTAKNRVHWGLLRLADLIRQTDSHEKLP